MNKVELDSGMSKTLHTGLLVLELLSTRSAGMTISQIAESVGVHRTVAHRIVRTLEAHRLCRRDARKMIFPGAGLVPLAEPVERDLRTLALPILEALADTAGATANLVVGEGDEHVRALLVVEPRGASIHVSFQPGQLDRIDRGSAGLAILASRQPQTDERAEVADTRRRGYAVSFSEVIPSVFGVSAFVPTSRQGEPISIGLSVFQLGDEVAIGRLVTDAATRLGRALG